MLPTAGQSGLVVDWVCVVQSRGVNESMSSRQLVAGSHQGLDIKPEISKT
uniref:Uncharacterized protein n=1 Tax=Triticum urartu TaxID=4572 RepID=A0A8R7R8W1_TRIUA